MRWSAVLKKILVTGASGATGRRIVAALTRSGASVRAFIRRTSAQEELALNGAQDFVHGSLEDDDALTAAVAGVDGLIHICPPMHPEEDRIASRIIETCKRAGGVRLILWSVLHPLIDVPHHRRKLVAEAALVGSDLPYTILQPARYMQHLAPIWPQVLETGVHSMPFSAAARFSLADLDDLAEAAAIVATQPGHDFATYQLAGPEALSQEDCAAALSRLLGRPIEAKARPIEGFLAQMRQAGAPDYRVKTLEIMNRHYDAHGLIGNSHVLQWLLGRAPNRFEDYVRRELMSGPGAAGRQGSAA